MSIIGIITKLTRIIMVVLCFILLIVGLIIMGAGIAIIALEDQWKPLAQSFEDSLKDGLEETGIDIDTKGLTVAGFIEPLSTYLIGFGTIFSIIALSGCCGACCKIRTLLVVFCCTICIMFGIHCIMVISMYENPSFYDGTIKTVFYDTIKDFRGLEATNIPSLAWNALMITLECCGVDNYKDFNNLDKWPPTTLFNIAIPELQNLKTPIFCCKNLPDLSQMSGIPGGTQTSFLTCATNPTSTTSRKDVGCYPTIWNIVVYNVYMTMYMVCSTSVQGGLVACSLWLLCIDGVTGMGKQADTENPQKMSPAQSAAMLGNASQTNSKLQPGNPAMSQNTSQMQMHSKPLRGGGPPRRGQSRTSMGARPPRGRNSEESIASSRSGPPRNSPPGRGRGHPRPSATPGATSSLTIGSAGTKPPRRKPRSRSLIQERSNSPKKAKNVSL